MFKVLIVEDHASMRESLTTALEAAGDFTVVGEVPNADYALDFCRHLHPDLVLIDVCTEGGASGLKAVEAIRKAYGEIKIIVIVGFTLWIKSCCLCYAPFHTCIIIFVFKFYTRFSFT